MKIAFIAESFHKGMGYIENCLPPHLAQQGHEVHIITCPLQPYHRMGNTDQILGSFAQTSRLQPNDIEEFDGCTLHVLEHGKIAGKTYLKNLGGKLEKIKPDVVQITSPIGPIAVTVAAARIRLGFALFSGNHLGFSSYAPSRGKLPWFHPERLGIWFMRGVHGRLIGLLTERCYAVTSDSAEVAWRFFGVPKKKIEVVHLGSDSRYFHPLRSDKETESRNRIRAQLGFSSSDIVCIFTGKMDDFRNPLLLAKAVLELRRQNKPFQGLFVGAGTQREAIEKLGFSVLDFMPFRKLGDYYRASEIGVWPGPESISQLDAAGCGLPLIVGDVGHYRDHVEGNGIVYSTGNLGALVDALSRLESGGFRRNLGNAGAQKIESGFSWRSIAERRIGDYRAALSRKELIARSFKTTA